MGTTEATGRDLVPGFGEMIREAREALGWSCAKLGEDAGVSANTVSAIERDVRAPSLRVASALVVALGLKVWLDSPTAQVQEKPAPKKPKGKKT